MHRLTPTIPVKRLRGTITTLIIVLGLLSSVISAGEPNNVSSAVLSVQANEPPVVIGTIGPQARIYCDRGANFSHIPQFLQGLQYTLHERGKIVSLFFQVKDSGRIYLCLLGRNTPKDIGQYRGWKKCGSMRGLGFFRKKKWSVYQTDVQRGEILILPQPDKFGLTVVAKEIIIEETRPLPKMPAITEAEKHTAGKSVEGRPVDYFVFGDGNDALFIMAAIHGDERMGIWLAHRLALHLQEHQNLLSGRKVILLPIANPDGVARYRHNNSNDVNLNRNFEAENRSSRKWAGPYAVSEPEARAIKRLIEEYKPNRIVSIHQVVTLIGPKATGMVDCDGPAEALAERMSEYCKLPAQRWGTESGSLGAYAGESLGIPIVTLELPKFDVGLTPEQLWDEYGDALVAAVTYPQRTSKVDPVNKTEINVLSLISE